MKLLDRFSKFVAALPFTGNAAIHEAANTSRSRTNMPALAQDSRRDVPRWSRQQILGLARSLCANGGLARGSINDIARYSVGSGLIPQAQTEDESWNSAAEAFWREWCKVADVSGRFHFNRMQRILSIATDRDGDIGLKLVKSATGFPQVQLIEAHRIGDGTDPIGYQPQSNAEWFDGVKLNAAGRATAYRIVTSDSLGVKTVEEIPASDFILLFDAERGDQVRGVSALYHAITNLRDRKDILDFEKIGVKRDSAMWAKMKTPSGEPDDADWDDEEVTVDGKKVVFSETRGGEVKVIATDQDLDPWNSNRPSPAFTGFLDHLVRDIATGLGVPYEFVWNPERLSGTSQRFILEKAQRRFRERQDLIENMVLNRLWFWVISVAIQRGDLAPMQDPWRVSWQRPAELSVDAGRDAAQDREDVKMGLMTEAEHYGRRGKDWLTERVQKEREVEDLVTRAQGIAKRRGIDFTLALSLLQLSTPNGNQPQSEDGQSKDKKKEKEPAK